MKEKITITFDELTNAFAKATQNVCCGVEAIDKVISDVGSSICAKVVTDLLGEPIMQDFYNMLVKEHSKVENPLKKLALDMVINEFAEKAIKSGDAKRNEKGDLVWKKN